MSRLDLGVPQIAIGDPDLLAWRVVAVRVVLSVAVDEHTCGLLAVNHGRVVAGEAVTIGPERVCCVAGNDGERPVRSDGLLLQDVEEPPDRSIRPLHRSVGAHRNPGFGSDVGSITRRQPQPACQIWCVGALVPRHIDRVGVGQLLECQLLGCPWIARENGSVVFEFQVGAVEPVGDGRVGLVITTDREVDRRWQLGWAVVARQCRRRADESDGGDRRQNQKLLHQKPPSPPEGGCCFLVPRGTCNSTSRGVTVTIFYKKLTKKSIPDNKPTQPANY